MLPPPTGFTWPHCPSNVAAQLQSFVDDARALIKNDLRGIYLHGSLALGCFNPVRSDLDLLLITANPLPLAIKRELAALVLCASHKPRPIEMSALYQAQLTPWRYPTPFDFHYGESWRLRLERDLATEAWRAWPTEASDDPDLAAHVTVTRARGVRLCGLAIRQVFPQVPAKDYRASLLLDVHDALDAIERNPVYAILNSCRTLAFLHDGVILSKDEGGCWALPKLAKPLQPLIRAALADYRSPSSRRTLPRSDLERFTSFARSVLPRR